MRWDGKVDGVVGLLSLVPEHPFDGEVEIELVG